jgi:hypothetical protein
MAAAGQLLLTPRLRPRTGPALRPGPLPVTAALLSLICHGALVASVILAARIWSTPPTKAYVVNLVPAVAAVGSPLARPNATRSERAARAGDPAGASAPRAGARAADARAVAARHARARQRAVVAGPRAAAAPVGCAAPG